MQNVLFELKMKYESANTIDGINNKESPLLINEQKLKTFLLSNNFIKIIRYMKFSTLYYKYNRFSL